MQDNSSSRLTPPMRADFAVFQTMPTRWADNDQYGHMNNVIHYALFDTAVSNWQLEQGFFDAKGALTRMVIAQSGCTYHAEAGYPDIIHVGLSVGRIGNSSWRYDMGLFRNDEMQAFADGFFLQVQVDAKTNKGKPLDDKTRAALQSLMTHKA